MLFIVRVKKIILFVLLILFVPLNATAFNGSKAFEEHKMVMLLIEPESGTIVKANSAAEEFYGYSISDFESMKIQDINTLSPQAIHAEMRLAKKEKRNYFIFQHRTKSGDLKTVEVSSIPLVYQGSTVLYSIIRDISGYRAAQEGLWHYQHRLDDMVKEQSSQLTATHQRQLLIFTALSIVLALALAALFRLLINQRNTKAQLEDEKKRLSDVIWAANIGTWEWDLSSDRLTLNDFAYAMVGYERWADFPVKRASLQPICHPDDWIIAQQNMVAKLEGKASFFQTEIRVRHRLGHWVWILVRGRIIKRAYSTRKPLAVAGTYQDITLQKELNSQLYLYANTDQLAEIPNRRSFHNQLDQMEDAEHHYGLFYMDLNKFKNVNDKYGHAAGDLVIKNVGQRLKGVIRSSDNIYRLGGDEFAVIVKGLKSRADASVIANKFVKTLSEPHVLEGMRNKNVIVPPSIGVAFYPDNGLDAESLIQRADQMMYLAKRNYPEGGYEIFGEQLAIA
ncbi:diguanylate cyclase domain-containing protein [Vibrio ziniensis]|uniref:Diguanylate cyclase n=1 Tax=Vibrio ziniensis TaxID=2711221 RepID=A0A6G7CGN6_9VIBR|nr:diguanylate cyclase [Vibrio ziniensis]QIH41275.1 diguanylate cyclase [Vibrio ziniensis]